MNIEVTTTSYYDIITIDYVYNHHCLFLHKESKLLSKYTRYTDGNDTPAKWRVMVRAQYDHNNMPLRVMVNNYDHNILKQRMRWEDKTITYYEDNNGNWYDNQIINGECPFQPQMQDIKEAIENVNFLVQHMVLFEDVPHVATSTINTIKGLLFDSSQAHKALKQQFAGGEPNTI